MDIRILSFLFALILLAATHYGRGPQAEPPKTVAAVEEASSFQFADRHQLEDQSEKPATKNESVVPASPRVEFSPSPAPTPSPSPSPTPSPLLMVEDLAAHNAALFDAKTGEVLFLKNAETPVPIASISKLMTAVIAREVFAPDTVVTLSAEDLADVDHHPDLGTGDSLTLDEALHLLLIPSDNSVALALARTYGTPGFVQKMNEKVAALNMTNTFFEDATGYLSNRSTARDLLRLAQYILASHEDLFQITRIPAITILTKQGKHLQLKNRNELAGKTFNLVGGKTGFTEDAGGCLLTVFTRGKRMMVSVILGSVDRFGDTKKLMDYSKIFSL